MADVSRPRVSVVIPAYGRTELLRKALLSLFEQDLEGSAFEILVVDSSPDAANMSLVRELTADAPCAIRCLTKTPEGPGPSRTLGAGVAQAPIVAFMDSDCAAAPGWLRSGLDAFAPGIGLVQGRTLPDPGGRRGVFSHYVVVERESFYYEAANIFYRRDELIAAGGFPADLTPTAGRPLGGEDTEAAWNVIRRGWKTRFAADAIVYHAVYPAGVWRWLYIKQLFAVPRLICRIPELRRFMALRYFFDVAQALFVCGLAGAAAAVATGQPWWLLPAMPYIVFRASEETRTLRGILRPLRIPPYFLRDVCSFLILLTASVRYRSLLL